MTPTENVELVRSIFEVWARGDFSVDEWAHPDIEAVIADGPAPVARRGLPAMAEGWRDLLRAWEGFRNQPERYLELDDERVLVLCRYSGRGKTSGVDLEQIHPKGALLFHVRAGKVTKAVHWFDRAGAFADLGIEA